MKINLVALLSGIIFGLGLALSQMIDPNKVLNFLDVTGNWDPSLAFVMIGALAVTMLSFRFILKRPTPLLDSGFHVSRQVIINRPLLIGAGIFGIGWGMTGYCPGPAISSTTASNLVQVCTSRVMMSPTGQSNIPAPL